MMDIKITLMISSNILLMFKTVLLVFVYHIEGKTAKKVYYSIFRVVVEHHNGVFVRKVNHHSMK